MKKKQKLAAFFLLLGVLTAGGCAETPQESAVISKADGLSETSVAKPMKEGETREIEVPGQWKAQEKRGNDRVTMEAELEMETPRVGNLPVLELQNHELTQEELEELVSYFAEGEKLYVPRIANQDDYQEVIDRIDQKEGKYANPNLAVLYGQYKEWYEKAATLAPEKDGEDKETQPAFGKKQEDPEIPAAFSGRRESLSLAKRIGTAFWRARSRSFRLTGRLRRKGWKFSAPMRWLSRQKIFQ